MHACWPAAALLVFVNVMKDLPASWVLRTFSGDPWPWWPSDEHLGQAARLSLAIVRAGLVPVLLSSRGHAAALIRSARHLPAAGS